MIIKKEIEKIILNIWYPKSRFVFIISKILSPIGFIYFFASYLKSLISKASLVDNKEKKPHDLYEYAWLDRVSHVYSLDRRRVGNEYPFDGVR